MSRKRSNNPDRQPDVSCRPIKAKSENQRQYIESIKHDEVIFAIGSAGTGKTFIPSVMAADMYNNKEISKIILTRPTVECGESLGLLPGTLEEKFEPWMSPFVQVMKKRMSAGAWDCAIKNQNIKYVPLQYMRGLSLNDAFIICDEAQNITIEQIKMLTTRIGFGSKLIITGDTKQSDISSDSGLNWLIDKVKRYQLPFDIVEFTLNDCVRSPVCKQFLELYEQLN